MDWNNDGKKDLLTGGYDGKLRIYLNTNTDADPKFNGYNHVMLSGSQYDCGSVSVPDISDWNNDGLFDILVGEGSGKVALLLNSGSLGSPVFRTQAYLQNGSGVLKEPMRVNPEVVDWDGDGNKDLLLGEEFGHLYFYRNIGTDEDPVFNGKTEVTANGFTFEDICYCRTRVDVVDWDEDGTLDLIAGQGYSDTSNQTNVFYCHGIGPLSLSENRIYASAGGVIDLAIKAGASYSGRKYFLLGNVSGTQPGTDLPGGLTLPLNWDVFTDLVISLANTPVCSNFSGTLDGNGEASAQFNSYGPLPSSSIGVPLRFAYLLYKPFDFVSNAAEVEILP